MSRHTLVTDYPHAEINLGVDLRDRREAIDEVVDVLADRPLATLAAFVALGALAAGVMSTMARRSRARHDLRDVRIARALRRHADPLR
jgi:hypothetical protein